MSEEREYIVSLFREEGFTRKRCKVCGRYFWTLNAEAENCCDAPCTPYFFDSIRVKSPLSVGETRRVFLKFFEKRGHTILKPRPVVARWREDLYLTIASIVVFQPHVTSGIVPPPANPLVISQPCIRLEDVDFVGLTLGRHLTLFEMGGHHAFNREGGERIYWKDETVRYAFEFFTKEIGIPPENICFKESWWEGGGNAGPCFEVTVGGLELATLVFMKYRVNGGKLEEIPLKIVDTGYGIERISWFTQKTPTAFHAIYGDLIKEFRGILGVEEPPEQFYKAAFKEVGLLDPENEDSIHSFISRIAREAGMSFEDAERVLEKEAKLYTVLDHTKTLAFMLADGIVPSNQGEGYLARLVIRRALRTLAMLDAEVSLSDLVAKQVGYWSADFPHLKENVNYILEVVELEQQKFQQLLREKLPRVAAEVRKNPSIEFLKKVYSETGIPPELVAKEIERRWGDKISVPRNFYSIMAKEGKPLASGQVEELEDWLKDVQPTRMVFHENPYAKTIDATVVAVNGNMVVLDRTVAYPEGGGQESDTGWIVKGERKYRFGKVVKKGDKVVHVIDEKHDLKPGDTVRVVIDWERRYKLMRHHTATHIILGALRKVLGKHVWQAGAEKTPSKARLDFTHYKPLSSNEIAEIEEIANNTVLRRLPVKTFVVDRNKAEEVYGLTLYQGGVPLEKNIRVVEIPGHDAEACFGTHVANTGEVGGIKIVSCTKLQDGVFRLEYVAGTETAKYAGRLEHLLDEAKKIVGGGREMLPKRVSALAEELERNKELLSKYRCILEGMLYSKLWETSSKIGEFTVITNVDKIGDQKLATEILKRIAESKEKVIAFWIRIQDSQAVVEISESASAAEKLPATRIVEELKKKAGARGGGKPTHAFARIPMKKPEPDEVVKLLMDTLRSLASG